MLKQWLGIGLLAALAALLLAVPSSARADEPEFQQSLAQAKIFMKREAYREAVQELRKALSTDQGEKSFDAHLMYAQASFKIYDIPQAVEYARQATELSTDLTEVSQAQDLYNYLTLAFGKVEFIAGEDELNEGYIILKPLEPILDPEIQGYFDAKVKPLFEQKRSLPWLMWLPTMMFEINGNEFSVVPADTIRVEAGFTAEAVAAQEAAVRSVRDAEQDEARRHRVDGFNPEVRLGYGAVLSGLQRDDGMVTGAALDVLGVKEFGLLGAGLFINGGFSNVATHGGESAAQPVTDLMVGALARAHIFLPGRLSLFPAVGVAWGTVGGAAVTCDTSTSGKTGDRVTYSDCSSGTDTAYSSAMSAYVRVAGVGGIGRLDLLIERPSDSMFRGVTIGLHAAALKASPFNEANRTSEQLVLADGATEPVSQSVTEELDLSSVGSSMVIKAGLMVGARMAF